MDWESAGERRQARFGRNRLSDAAQTGSWLVRDGQRGGGGGTSSAQVGPSLGHQAAPALEEGGAGVCGFHLVLDGVRERSLDDLPRVIRLFSGPVPEAGPETVRDGLDPAFLEELGQRHVGERATAGTPDACPHFLTAPTGRMHPCTRPGSPVRSPSRRRSRCPLRKQTVAACPT